jgi:hypothetical protein
MDDVYPSQSVPQRSSLDTEIDQILNGTFPEDLKVKLYLNAVQKNRALESSTSTLVNNALAEKINAVETQSSAGKNIENEIIQFLPPSHHYKAKRVWKLINADANIRWTPDHQLIYQNRVVQGSNAADIFIDLYQRSAINPPPGSSEIVQSLLSANVPHSLIINTRRLKTVIDTPSPQAQAHTPDSAAKKSSSSSSSSAGPSARTRKALETKKRKVDGKWLPY